MTKADKQKDLEQVNDRFSFSTEENYLKIALDSYSQYNHRARLDIADILYKKYLELKEDEATLNLRRNLVAEVYTKLMQALEDSSLLVVMFMNSRKKAFNHFLNTDTRAFNKFFKKAKRGLSDRQILAMYGLKPIGKLIKDGLVAPQEKIKYNDFFKELCKKEKDRWRKLANLYLKRYKPPQKKIDYKKSGAISVYHNIKHAFKVLLPTELYKKIWVYDENEPSVAVVEEYIEFSKASKKKLPKELKKYENQKILIIGSLEVSKEAITELFQRIHVQAQNIKIIAENQLKLMDDPSYVVRELRFMFYRESDARKPKHFELCPCGSKIKFKKCHARRTENTDYLFFKEKTVTN